VFNTDNFSIVCFTPSDPISYLKGNDKKDLEKKWGSWGGGNCAPPPVPVFQWLSFS